ncbi:MAG: MoxR family ATPase, partial [Bacteroidota bacterium]
GQVSIGNHTFELPNPFLVLATQNPIDQEGTYPLPEAQVDRFMLKVFVDYPDKYEEKEIMRRMAKTAPAHQVQSVFSLKDILEVRTLIDQIQLSEKLEDYIVDIIMATRQPKTYGLEQLEEYIDFGASPRASLALNLGARAHAFLSGRGYVLPEDIKAITPDVLNHRIILNYEAEAEDINTMNCIDLILRTIEI